MANDVTTQSTTPATVPSGTKIATIDLGGLGRHAQVVLVGGATTNTTSSVASSATTVQILAANTSRVGAGLYNDSTAFAYVKLGTTASTTDFTILLGPGGYYEVPYGYNGRIDALWSAAQGSMRCSELT